MATFTVNDSSRSWSVRDLQTFSILNATAGTVNNSYVEINGTTLSGDPITATFTGRFDVFGSSVFGTIDSISFRIDGSTAISATDLNASYTDYTNIFSSTFENAATAGNDLFSINSTRSGFWETGTGNDTINSGSGDDFIDGEGGVDRYVADDSFGKASLTSSFGNVTVESADGRDHLTSIELVEFSNITFALEAGTSGNNGLNGDQRSGTPSDLILGGSGNDTISGFSGKDLLLGEDGSDRLLGGDGSDTLSGGSDNDALLGGSGRDRLFGNAGNDTLSGGNHGDNLSGGSGSDTLEGGFGGDRLNGGSGNDSLSGGGGNDTLNGGKGRDVLLGHKGNDLLTGGGSSDTFLFHKGHGNDTITDFTAGEDQIEIGRGASGMNSLDFTAQGDDVLVSFADVTILVEDISMAQLQQADNFLF